MICPPIWRAAVYMSLAFIGIAGAVLAESLGLRIALAVLGIYSSLCFSVTGSWRSFLVPFRHTNGERENGSQRYTKGTEERKGDKSNFGEGE
jgi:hypothetical protein